MFFNWTRPSRMLYPNVWLKFKAKDLFTNELVEYTIKDLPEERFDDAIEIMAKGFLANVQMAELKNGANDMEYIKDLTRIWNIILNQKMTHICLKENSQEIVGLKMNYVSSKDDVSFLDDKVIITLCRYQSVLYRVTYVSYSLKVHIFFIT